MTGMIPRSFHRIAPSPSTRVESTNSHAVHSRRRLPNHATAPVDDLLRREGKPPPQLDLAVHVYKHCRCELRSGSNCVLKVAPRCFWKGRESSGRKAHSSGEAEFHSSSREGSLLIVAPEARLGGGFGTPMLDRFSPLYTTPRPFPCWD